MGATRGAGTAYPPGAPEFTPDFSGVRGTRSLVLCVCFVDRCLSFCTCFLSLCCLVFFDIRILITLWYLQTLLPTSDMEMHILKFILKHVCIIRSINNKTFTN